MQIGAEIFKRALSYPARQIAKNAGANGSVVVEKVSAYQWIIFSQTELTEHHILPDNVFYFYLFVYFASADSINRQCELWIQCCYT